MLVVLLVLLLELVTASLGDNYTSLQLAPKLLRCGHNHTLESPSNEEEAFIVQAKKKKLPPKKKLLMYEIPIVFHIIMDDLGELGNVPIDSLQQTIKNANLVFRGQAVSKGRKPIADSKLRIALQGVTYTYNSEWFYNCQEYDNFKQMRVTLAVNPEHAVNVYLCRTQNLGWTSNFPYEIADYNPVNSLFVHFQTFPSSPTDKSYEPIQDYSDGDSFTHELGHLLGLKHTFGDGVGSCVDGDGIKDTPPQAYASGGKSCKVKPAIDTCPNAPGVDPVWNMMEYSDDTCAEEFTPGQALAMRTNLERFKPTLFTKQVPGRCVVSSEGNQGTGKPHTICMSDCYAGQADKGGKPWCYTSRFDPNEWGVCDCRPMANFPVKLLCANKPEREERWVHQPTGQCVTAHGRDGSLTLEPCRESVFQRWAFQPSRQIVSIGTGWCLDVQTDANLVRLQPCDLAIGNQRFKPDGTLLFDLPLFADLQQPARCLNADFKMQSEGCGNQWSRQSSTPCQQLKTKAACINQSPLRFGCGCVWTGKSCVN